MLGRMLVVSGCVSGGIFLRDRDSKLLWSSFEKLL